MKTKNAKSKGKTRITDFVSRVLDFTNGSVENIVAAIKEDHHDLKNFIKVMKDEKATLAEKKGAYKGFSGLLKSHASSEEKALYQRCLGSTDLRMDAEEGYVEHHVADLLMKSIGATKNKDQWRAKVKVIAELVEHHIQEEESNFLPKVSNHFGAAKKEQMSKKFISLRQSTQSNISSENAGVLALK